MAKLADIEGIGAAYVNKMEAIGIRTLKKLLDTCADKRGRKQTAKTSGVSEKLLLKWVNRADLTRIKGVSTQYSDLLELAGVDSVPELAQRKAENLHTRMLEVNADKHVVRKTPGLSQVENWIVQAKKLARIVSH